MLPYAIDHDASGERVIGPRQPLCEFEPAAATFDVERLAVRKKPRRVPRDDRPDLLRLARNLDWRVRRLAFVHRVGDWHVRRRAKALEHEQFLPRRRKPALHLAID